MTNASKAAGTQGELGEPVEEDVVTEADEQQQQQVAVSPGGQRIEHEERHPPPGDHRHIHGAGEKYGAESSR